MSVNRERPYLIVLFEDNAYKDLFLGFEFSFHKQIQQKPVLQGFDDVLFQLTNSNSTTLKELNKYPNAYILAITDADMDSHQESNIDTLKKSIKGIYRNRIFVLGSKYEAENIKKEIIGQGKWRRLAKELESSCQNDSCELWHNDMLKHNLDEIVRLRQVFEWVQ